MCLWYFLIILASFLFVHWQHVEVMSTSGISWLIFLQGNQYLCIDADETGSLVALGTKDGQ